MHRFQGRKNAFAKTNENRVTLQRENGITLCLITTNYFHKNTVGESTGNTLRATLYRKRIDFLS